MSTCVFYNWIAVVGGRGAGKELARGSFYFTAKGSLQEEDNLLVLLNLKRGVIVFGKVKREADANQEDGKDEIF